MPFGDVKALFEALYTEGSNPIEDEVRVQIKLSGCTSRFSAHPSRRMLTIALVGVQDEVGEDFEGYWINAIMVPGTFAGAEENGEPDWHSYVNYARLAEADHADEAVRVPRSGWRACLCSRFNGSTISC